MTKSNRRNPKNTTKRSLQRAKEDRSQKLLEELRRKWPKETIEMPAMTGELSPGQVSIERKVSFLDSVKNYALAAVVISVVLGICIVVGWGGIWLIGKTFSGINHYIYSQKTLGPIPQYPTFEYVTVVSTDEKDVRKAVVLAYEDVQIVCVEKRTDIPTVMQKIAINPIAGSPLFTRFQDLTIPTPWIIEGSSFDIKTGPLVEHDEMIARLEHSYQGLQGASILFAYDDRKGPPIAQNNSISNPSLSKRGRVQPNRVRVIYVVGKIEDVSFPDQRDRSYLDLTVSDRDSRNRDGLSADLSVWRRELENYYSSAYLYNRVAEAHNAPTLPIDPNFVSRDIRREIGRETAEDLEQDRREFQVWTEKLKQDVRELGK